MIGDCIRIGAPDIDRLAIVSRSTVAAPAFIGAAVTLIDSVVLGPVELRHVTLVGCRVSGRGRIVGRSRDTDETHLIIRADLEVWQAETVRLDSNVDWRGVAILGAGRITGHLTIEPTGDIGQVEALPDFWRTQPITPEQCAKDLEHALGALHVDPFMERPNNETTHRPHPAVTYKVRVLPGEP